MIRRRLVRRKGDGFELKVGDPEARVVGDAVAQVRELIESDAGGPLARRLFPPAYHAPEDVERQADFRSLMHDELVERRHASLGILERALVSRRIARDEMDAFMGAVNDVRLVLGTRLDVKEDDPPSRGLGGPDASLYALYGYLSLLLEHAIEAATG